VLRALKAGANSATKIDTIVIIRKVLKTGYLCVGICLNGPLNQSGIFDISFNFLALFSFIVFGHAGVSGHVRNEWARPQALNKQSNKKTFVRQPVELKFVNCASKANPSGAGEKLKKIRRSYTEPVKPSRTLAVAKAC
jgi:hypothetical protein